MKTFLVSALALSGMTAVAPANAATYVRNGVIDTSAFANGVVVTNANVVASAIAYDPIATLAVGDVVTGTVSFAGGRVATMYDVGNERLNFWLAASGFPSISGAWTLSFTGVSGALLANSFSSSIGGCCTGPAIFSNATNSAFSFTGFDYSVTMKTANTNVDAYNFSTSRISFADGASAVPEPATWAMMTLGFGAIGFAMRRRKVELRTRLA